MRRMMLTCVFSLVALDAGAQTAPTDITLPDTVTTATRIPTLIEQIPAGVTVVDRAAIEARGYTTLTEALSAVPGLHVVQSGPQGGNASVFIRGTNSNHVLVLRDGVPVNDPSDPGGAFNFGVDTLDDIERIEIVRGPMSSLYGSGAIGGVINLISRHGDGTPHGSVELATGIPRAFLGQANLSGKTGRFDYSLSAESRTDRGFDTTPRREAIYTGARNPYSTTLGELELGVTPIDGTRVAVQLRGRESRFGLDEVGSPGYDANNYIGHDDAVFGRLYGTSSLFSGIWDTQISASRLQTDRHYGEPLEDADPNMAFGDSRYHGRRTDVQWNNTVHLPDYGPARNSAVLFGYEHIDDGLRARINTSSAGFAFQSDVRANDSSDAGHAGLQSTLFDRLTVTADARQEGGTYGGDAFTWRAGGVVQVPEILSHFKASYGTGFRAPSLNDLFGVDSTGYAGNPNLKPERSIGYELGWGIDVPAFGRTDAASLDVTYFNNRIRDLITFVFNADGTSTEANVARARSQGVETSLTVKPLSWLVAIGSYTYTDSRNQTDGTLLLRRPVHAASLNVRATPLPGLTIAPEVVYTGSFRDYIVDDFGFQSFTPARARAGTIVNLNVSYDVIPRVRVFVDARNIGGSRFEPASGFQTPGPEVLLGTRVRF